MNALGLSRVTTNRKEKRELPLSRVDSERAVGDQTACPMSRIAPSGF